MQVSHDTYVDTNDKYCEQCLRSVESAIRRAHIIHCTLCPSAESNFAPIIDVCANKNKIALRQTYRLFWFFVPLHRRRKARRSSFLFCFRHKRVGDPIFRRAGVDVSVVFAFLPLNRTILTYLFISIALCFTFLHFTRRMIFFWCSMGTFASTYRLTFGLFFHWTKFSTEARSMPFDSFDSSLPHADWWVSWRTRAIEMNKSKSLI